MQLDLFDNEVRCLIDYAGRKYAEERYPLAPALRPIRGALPKLDTACERLPAPKHRRPPLASAAEEEAAGATEVPNRCHIG
jgi:hypothetical protein